MKLSGSRSILLLGLVVFSVDSARAQEPPNEKTDEDSRPTVVTLDDSKIKQLIKDLDSNDFATRDQALKALSTGAKHKASLLIDVTLDASSSFEARTRCLKILQSWSSSASESERKSISKTISRYALEKYPDSRELQLLREYFLLDLSQDPKVAMEKLKAGGMKITESGGKLHLTATNWKGQLRELGYLQSINRDFRLSATPQFLESAMAHLKNGNVTEIYLNRTPSLNKGRRPFRAMPENVSDNVMSQLPTLKKLVRFDMSFINASDKGLKNLAKCTSLESLTLSTGISDDGLSFIQELSNLKNLRFHNAFQMKGPGLKHISKLKKLQNIELFYTGIQSKYLRHITELPNLVRLYLPQTSMNDEGMEHISKIESLNELILDNTHVTNAGLSKIKNLPNLTSIDLVSGSFSNAGVMELVALPKLRSVRISAGVITRDVVKMLNSVDARFKISGQYFKPNSPAEYESIEKLLASGIQINQYPRPNNLTLFIYPSWNGDAAVLQEIRQLKEIKHLRLYIYGALTEDQVDELVELGPSLSIRLFPEPNNSENVMPEKLAERLKGRFPEFSR